MSIIEALPAFAATSGKRDAKVVIVGEAWGQHEAEMRRPFIGESGKELFLMLGEAMPEVAPELHAEVVSLFRYGLAWAKRRDEWLAEANLLFTNVLALRPPANKIDELCGKKGEMGEGYDWPHLSQGKYLRPEFLPEVARLYEEIKAINPNLVIACGNTACWALLRATNIGSIRGAVAMSTDLGGGYRVKTLPTYHPAGVLRQWAWRPIVVTDLMKASREGRFAEIKRPDRKIIVSPTLAQVQEWTSRVLANPPPLLGCDTETAIGQITMIGFAPSRDEALVIPFVDPAKPGRSYWQSLGEELAAWDCAKALLEAPIVKVFQNGLYDFQYILPMGIQLVNCLEDTMLLHHSHLPEMKKGLGFLGSVYTSETSWKLMRVAKADTEKRDE